jgi:hypothetical protein
LNPCFIPIAVSTILFHETGYQFTSFAGSYSLTRLDLLKEIMSQPAVKGNDEGANEANPKLGVKVLSR